MLASRACHSSSVGGGSYGAGAPRMQTAAAAACCKAGLAATQPIDPSRAPQRRAAGRHNAAAASHADGVPTPVGAACGAYAWLVDVAASGAGTKYHCASLGAAAAASSGIGVGLGSSSGSKSAAELAESYLLQHADTLQAKQPSAPSRATVMAWRAVCERQWAEMSLPLTLQAAAAVMASIQLKGASSSSGRACSACIPSVWDIQDCGALDGHIGATGQGSPDAGAIPPAALSGDTAGVQNTPSTRSSNSHRDSSGSGCSPLTHLGSEAVLSITSCSQKATALSAVCLHLADNGAVGNTAGSGLVHTLLATAAASVSLQGAAALPLVTAAVSAATALVNLQPAVQQPQITTEQQRQQPWDTGSSAPHTPPSNTQSSDTTATRAHLSDEPFLCLSLAADLTKAGLQVEGEPAVQSTLDKSYSLEFFALLQLLLERTQAKAHDSDTATQMRQLQSIAYTLQLLASSGGSHKATSSLDQCQNGGLRG